MRIDRWNGKRAAIFHQKQAYNLAKDSRRDELPELYRIMCQKNAAYHYALARYHMRIRESRS